MGMRRFNHPLLALVSDDPDFFSPDGKAMNDRDTMARQYAARPAQYWYNDDGQGNRWDLYREPEQNWRRQAMEAGFV